MKKIDFASLIIKETQDYIFINKPSGLSSLEDRNDRYSVLSLAQGYNESSQLCHRLDKDTSGVLAVAKHAEAYRHLAILLEKREVEKIYHAIVDGRHDLDTVKVDVPLYVTGNGKVKTDFQLGKPATTLVRTRKIYKLHSFIECKPLSGRTHQIRAHLSYIGAPIVADGLYGGKPIFLSSFKRNFNMKQGEEERPLIGRFALHAFSLGFQDVDGENCYVEAPYLKDMRALIRQLEMH